MVNKALSGCVLFAHGNGSANNVGQLRNWIEEASGKLASKVTADTTHVLVDNLINKHGQLYPAVEEAYKLRKLGHDIEIVTFDWLTDSTQAKSRKREKKYRVAGPSEHTKEPRTTAGLLGQAYMKDTDRVMDPAMRTRQENDKRRAEEAAKEQEDEMQRQYNEYLHKNKKLSVAEFSIVFKRSAQKAKAIILSDNYHIYRDSTGFHLDVVVTKVNTKVNMNERYHLVIFESNTTPHTYAFATVHSGTKILQDTKVIVAIGANFTTAFSAFKRLFEEKTGVPWAQRIKVAEERAHQEELSRRSKKMGEHARKSLGLPPAPKAVDDFINAPYQYYPPTYGPRGEMEDGSHLQIRATAGSKGKGRATEEILEDDEQEFLMSGGNGNESPVLPDFSTKDLEAFHEAVNGGELKPLSEPFQFSSATDFEAYVAGGAEESGGGGGGGDGLTQGIDFTGFDLAPEFDGLAETQASDVEAGSDPERSVLGKRKDSRFQSPAEKRLKGLEEEEEQQQQQN